MASYSDYLRYANQGATRNLPLSPKLVNDLSYLKNLGVQAEVFSGGQEEEGPNRTGSHRHDDGNAADMRFYKDGRQISWQNPDDLPIFQQIVEQGKANGITGIGAGPGYMSPGTMHMGFGTPGVWGAGGSGANAPDWLRKAFGMAPTGLTMGAPQGNVPPVNGVMPALDPAPQLQDNAPQVAAASTAPAVVPPAAPTVGDKIGSAIFGDDLASTLKGQFGQGAPANTTGKQGMGLLSNAFGGGQKSDAQAAADREAANIQPSGNQLDDTAQRQQGAAALMAALIAKRKQPQIGGGLMMGG